MESGTVVGLRPWFPWPLRNWPWLTEPVAAERLAALRIGLAVVLLIDLLTTYVPHVTDFFGQQSLGSPELFRWYREPPRWHWSVLGGVGNPAVLQAAMALWVVSVVGLLVGCYTRVSSVLAWVLCTSFANANPYIDNAGDLVRGIILLYLMLSPCGAVWSVDRRMDPHRPPAPVRIHPWVLRLLFVQMSLIYFCNGCYKAAGADWWQGESLYYVLGDLTLARWSYAEFPVPFLLTRILSWTVLVWELTFPFWLLWGPSRRIALVFGAAFHLGIGVAMEVGWFAPYMLCLYLPLIPWENYTRRVPRVEGHVSVAGVGDSTRT